MPWIGMPPQLNRPTYRARELLATQPATDRTLIVDPGSLSDPLDKLKAADPDGTRGLSFCPVHGSQHNAPPDITKPTATQLTTQIGEAR